MSNIPYNYKFYKYVVEVSSIIIDDIIHPIVSEQVGGIIIEKDFNNDVFPVLRLQIAFTEKMYYNIIKHKNNIKIKVRIVKFITDGEGRNEAKSQLFSTIFTTFIDKEEPFISKDFNRLNDDKNETDFTFNKDMELYLFEEKVLNTSKSLINNVFVNCTLLDVFTFIMSSNRINNILLSVPDNDTVYDEILIPCQTLLSAVKYLDTQYGFYINGASLFFDIDRTYMLGAKPSMPVYSNNEFKEVIFSVENVVSPHAKNSGTIFDKDKKIIYMNVNPESVQFNNANIINDQVTGNSVLMIDSEHDDMNVIVPETKYNNGGLRLAIKTSSNKYLSERINVYTKSNERLMTLTLMNVDISSLTPNKIFRLVFSDQAINKQYGGQYSLCSFTTSLMREGREYKVSTQCNFKYVT